MNGKELLETYPRVGELIKKWFLDKMLENMANDDNVPEEFKKHMLDRGATDEFVSNVIDKNPAALFELFDTIHVYVGTSISQIPQTEKVVFNYYICPNGNCVDASPLDFIKRKDMEYYAVLAAITYIDENFDELIVKK